MGLEPETGDRSGERIVGSIRKLMRSLDVISRRLAADSGVTSPQLLCLRYVARAESATATEVAKRVHLSPSTVVGIIDRLEEKGLVARERDAKDRRVVRLAATGLGMELVRRTRHPVQAMFEDRKVNGLSDEDYERIAVALEDIVRVLGVADGTEETPLDAVGSVNSVETPDPSEVGL